LHDAHFRTIPVDRQLVALWPSRIGAHNGCERNTHKQLSSFMLSIALRRCALAVSVLTPGKVAAAQAQAHDSSSAAVGRDTFVTARAMLPARLRLPGPVDTPVVRPRAIEYSDFYYTRLTIHRYGSYAMIPLLAAEYSLGQNLMNDASPASWMKPAHAAVAGGIGVLFGVNTITGVWNLWESRNDPDGRTRRILHSVMLIAADAGFAATAALAPDDDHEFGNDSRHSTRVHRNVAIGSIALSTIGGGMMWFWK
jgi:hypothetical protein